MSEIKSAYVLMATSWDYNDEYMYTDDTDSGHPVAVFTTKDEAEVAKREREIASWMVEMSGTELYNYAYGSGVVCQLFDDDEEDAAAAANSLREIFAGRSEADLAHSDFDNLEDFAFPPKLTAEEAQQCMLLFPSISFYTIETIPAS